MNMRFVSASTIALMLALAACGKDAGDAVEYRGDEMLPNGLSIKQMIESRQHNFKDLGGAFKTVNDQLRQEQPLLQEIKFAAAEVQRHSQDVASWFPEGTGPDSGVDTEALPSIWSDATGYAGVIEEFKAAATALNDAARADDIEGVRAAVRPVGGTCKTCHDTYRLDDD